MLEARFGDSQLISECMTSRLWSGKSVSKAADVPQFAYEMSGAFSALSEMSMTNEINNEWTIKDILERCPLFIHHKWQQRALNRKCEKGKYPDFANFVDFNKKCPQIVVILNMVLTWSKTLVWNSSQWVLRSWCHYSRTNVSHRYKSGSHL